MFNPDGNIDMNVSENEGQQRQPFMPSKSNSKINDSQDECSTRG